MENLFLNDMAWQLINISDSLKFQTWKENAMHIKLNLGVFVMSESHLKKHWLYINRALWNIHQVEICSCLAFSLYDWKSALQMRRKYNIYLCTFRFKFSATLDEANRTASHFLNLPPEIEFFESGILGKSNLYSTIN